MSRDYATDMKPHSTTIFNTCHPNISIMFRCEAPYDFIDAFLISIICLVYELGGFVTYNSLMR